MEPIFTFNEVVFSTTALIFGMAFGGFLNEEIHKETRSRLYWMYHHTKKASQLLERLDLSQ